MIEGIAKRSNGLSFLSGHFWPGSDYAGPIHGMAGWRSEPKKRDLLRRNELPRHRDNSIDLEWIEMGKMYTTEHEWLLFDRDIVTVGITVHAQDALGDIVYVGLPNIGTNASQGEYIAEVESVKSKSEILAPVSGEVIAINEALNDSPELVNESPEDQGWLFKIRTSERSNPAWMSKSAYDEYVKNR
ncbi:MULTISPECIES: glycine cleavage system protein GcvH [unclassified Pseudomonas]|uniref:glycine cleavage system protein GcvH n=1 Tax=unclassified Pseudomonas TaxID=196821 RepID=UPI002113A1C3|nr:MULTISPECIES: glycine cleavage system protein GcvH [unclassified Pseudomonas]